MESIGFVPATIHFSERNGTLGLDFKRTPIQKELEK